MMLLFGRETYYVPGKPGPACSRFGSYFGIGNTDLPKRSTLVFWCRTLVIYIFKFPLLMTGERTTDDKLSAAHEKLNSYLARLRGLGHIHLAHRYVETLLYSALYASPKPHPFCKNQELTVTVFRYYDHHRLIHP